MTYGLPSTLRARMATLAALVATASALTALPASAQGTDKAAPTTPEAAGLKKVLEQRFPGAEIRGVTKAPYFGLYEVMLDDRIVYTDAKAKYVLVGAVYDTESKTNLTEERQRQQNRVDVAAIPLELAIKKVKGNGSRKLVVFSDPDCPFCARLEKTLKNIDNTTVYTFLLPIDKLHPDAARKARMIWCAADRQKAWDAHYDSGALPDNAGKCENPVAKTQALGASLKINGTPTLIFADGSMVAGAIPAERLEAEFAKADAELRKIAAAKK
jgi:thiol:disulfide interchange protein DsbC